MKLRTVALLGVVSVAILGLIGAGAQGVFTTSTASSQKITVGTFGAAPTITITYPVNNATYGADWTGTITGTASSNSGAGTSISAVSVAVEDTATGLWWNGISFASSTETFNKASGTTSWNLPLARGSLTSGVTYEVIAKATDSLGFVGTSSTVSFTYETASPTVAITYPVNKTTYGSNWAGTITGTAAAKALAATITKVQVSIQQVGGSCWTGSGANFTASCPNYLAVTSGTTSWSLTLPISDLTSGNSYKVTAQATDSLGNVATSSTVTFSYDSASPSVTITFPANGANVCACSYGGKITGTASSNSGSGTAITSVSVAIENTTTDTWWNGSSFAAVSRTWLTASGTTSWTFPLAAKYLTTGDTYSVTAETKDSLGNIGTSATVSFTYCLETPPTVGITYPVNGTTYGSNWNGEITGTASAASGTTIKSISVAIEDVKTSKWWNGSSFSASSATFNKATGTTTWFLTLAAKNLTSGVTYGVIAEATDSLGDVGTSSTVNFTYLIKTAPPRVTITYPVNNSTCGRNWAGEIAGTALAGTGASISKTAVAIEDLETSLWWNGSSFAAGSEDFVTASGTTTWLLALAAKNLTAGVSYSVVAEATDNLGNLGTSPTVTFTYS